MNKIIEEGQLINIPFDFHNHSTQSPDGENTVEEMVLRAIELGMKHYTITDHLEINKFYDEEFLYEEPVRQSSLLLPQLKEKYKGKISLQYGIELGQPLHDMDLTRRMLDSYNYDFIIGSCHMVRGYDDFYFIDYNETDPIFLLNLYFEELLEMSEWGGFDSLGHLTYPLRYIVGDKGIHIDLTPYEKIIDEIFRTLIKNNKGIEINTSGLRQNIGLTLPDFKYVKRFYDLGGRILTIGSDAHCCKDLGKGIIDGIEIARKAGFKEIACFKNRNPEFIKI
ncbi:MAG: histidinol-phosphatase HisJ family protein [Ruminococcus sp.]|nr:histidinol-phosphatase HisJ family protein [Ruminococcus sp.]